MKISERAKRQLEKFGCGEDFSLNEFLSDITKKSVFDEVDTHGADKSMFVSYYSPYNGLIVSVRDNTVIGVGFLYEVNGPKYIPQFDIVFSHGSDYSCVWDAETMEVIERSACF